VFTGKVASAVVPVLKVPPGIGCAPVSPLPAAVQLICVNGIVCVPLLSGAVTVALSDALPPPLPGAR